MRHGAQEVCDLTHYKRISHKMTRGTKEAINKLREVLKGLKLNVSFKAITDF
jgi:hypothetical protein